MAYMKNPLQEAHCNDLAYVLTRFPLLKATLEKLERCGLPCHDQLAALENTYNICASVRKEFDPKAAPLAPLPADYNPVKLTDQNCRDLDSVIAEYPALKETIAALERCGLPCEKALEDLERHYHICTAFKREFTPLAT